MVGKRHVCSLYTELGVIKKSLFLKFRAELLRDFLIWWKMISTLILDTSFLLLLVQIGTDTFSRNLSRPYMRNSVNNTPQFGLRMLSLSLAADIHRL